MVERGPGRPASEQAREELATQIPRSLLLGLYGLFAAALVFVSLAAVLETTLDGESVSWLAYLSHQIFAP